MYTDNLCISETNSCLKIHTSLVFGITQPDRSELWAVCLKGCIYSNSMLDPNRQADVSGGAIEIMILFYGIPWNATCNFKMNLESAYSLCTCLSKNLLPTCSCVQERLRKEISQHLLEPPIIATLLGLFLGLSPFSTLVTKRNTKRNLGFLWGKFLGMKII